MAFDRQLRELSSEALSTFAKDCFIAGYQIGYRLGFNEGFRKEIIKTSKRKFGDLSPTIIRKLKNLSRQKFDELIEV